MVNMTTWNDVYFDPSGLMQPKTFCCDICIVGEKWPQESRMNDRKCYLTTLPSLSLFKFKRCMISRFTSRDHMISMRNWWLHHPMEQFTMLTLAYTNDSDSPMWSWCKLIVLTTFMSNNYIRLLQWSTMANMIFMWNNDSCMSSIQLWCLQDNLRDIYI